MIPVGAIARQTRALIAEHNAYLPHGNEAEQVLVSFAICRAVGLDPIDLRWGYHRLTGLVAERMGRDARSGALFVFFGKRRDAMKVRLYDGTGVCRLYKRLDAGTVRIPSASREDTTVVELEERELDALLDGIEVDQNVRRFASGSVPRSAKVVAAGRHGATGKSSKSGVCIRTTASPGAVSAKS